MNHAAEIASPGWVSETAASLREAAAAGRPVAIEGAGTRRDLLPGTTAARISASAYHGVVDYEPSDLTITVRAGTPLDELDRTLQAEGQMLPFEPPRHPGSTVGGAVALGWSGPRRPFGGSVRDHVTGVRMLDGLGRDLRFGGPVVKNVAGFDVPRLMAGSRGALGMLLELCLRVVPAPRAEHTAACRCTLQEALWIMGRLPIGPGRLSGAAWVDGQLLLRWHGDGAPLDMLPPGLTVDPAPFPDGESPWRHLADQTHPFFAPRDGLQLWRLSVRLGAPALEDAAAAACDWAGALRWVWLRPKDGPRAHAWAHAHGGHSTPWPPRTPIGLPSPLQALQHRVADVFDPRRILQRARLLAPLEEAC